MTITHALNIMGLCVRLTWTAALWVAGIGMPVMFLATVYLLFIQPADYIWMPATSTGLPINEVRAGSVLEVERDVCVASAADGKKAVISRSIKGRDLQWLPPVEVHLSGGCVNRRWRVPLPVSLVPGYYEYRAVVTVPVNFMRAEDFALPPVTFKVVE